MELNKEVILNEQQLIKWYNLAKKSMQDKEGGIPPPSTLQKQETCFSFAYGKKLNFFY